MTKEHKEKIRSSLKKNFSRAFHSPDVRAKALATFRETLKDPEVRKKWSRAGSANNFWKGGRYIASGYVMVHIGRKKYIQEHQLVMEKKLGRKLNKAEVVHHINGIKTDNRPENLIATSAQKNLKYGSPLLKAAQRRVRELELLLRPDLD